jgi:hypothetical protein
MNCPRCHRDTYSKKWGTCTACQSDALSAINSEERLTNAINTPPRPPYSQGTESPKLAGGSTVTDAPVCLDGRRDAAGGETPVQLRGSSLRTPNRRSRESYNSYMKTYMRAYRERSK